MKNLLLKVTVVLCIVLMPVSSVYAKKKPAAEPVPAEDTEEYTADPSEGVTLKLPPKKSNGAFSGISPDVLAAVEDGGPEKLKIAVGMLKKNNGVYTDSELILINVAFSLLSILYPSENFIAEIPPVKEMNPYTGALDSARQGVYDSSTGNVDFLTIVLPSVVLITSETRSDYYDESEAALKKGLSMHKDSVLANYLLGTLYKRQARYEEALVYLTKAYEDSYDNLECGNAMIQCMLKLNQKEKAYTSVKRLLNSYPQNKTVLKLCAETAFVNEDLTNAELYVARVLQQEPDNTSYILFRAKILVKKGEYIKAASLLDVYARTDTKNRDYLVLRATIQKDWNRNITAATQTLEEALKLYPDDEEIILASAELSGETGAKIAGRSASELVNVILQKDPENILALKVQINEMMKAKNWSGAYKSSSALLKIKGRPEESLYTHIEICISAGKKDEAWRLASELYSTQSSNENVIQAYVATLVATNRTAEAKRLINQLLGTGSNKLKSFLYYEKSFLESGEDAVLADLRSSLTANPRNKDSLYRLYQIYYNKKEYRKAQYYLKQVVALSPSDESLLARNRELNSLLGN